MKKQWIDENGITIPGFRITKSEKLKEAICDSLLKKSLKAQTVLMALKEEMTNAANDVLEAAIAENGGKTRENYKGNFTFFNFDRSIKVESSIQEKIVFDDAMIIIAKDYFNDFLESISNTSDDEEKMMLHDIITDAFSTTKGKLDTDKVLNTTKYRSRVNKVKYPSYHLAVDAIEKGMSRQFSKKYHRISKRNEDGKYEAVDLNFSSL